jgi:hypothetical protein
MRLKDGDGKDHATQVRTYKNVCGTSAAAIPKDLGLRFQDTKDAGLSDSVSRHFCGIGVIHLQVIDLYHLTADQGRGNL